MVFIYLFFMLLDFEGLRSEITSLIPSRYRQNTFSFLHEFDMAMSTYFRAQAVIAVILGIIFAVGFTLIGLPLGIVLGFAAGLMTMVPYLQLTSIPIAILLALLQAIDSGSSIWLNFGLVLAVYAVVHIAQDFILVPRIIGNSTGLSPVMIMLSLSVWGSFLGIFGMIIAVPFTCLVLTYYRRLLKQSHEPESAS
jgi:predicted PurR-regulated permease PerM